MHLTASFGRMLECALAGVAVILLSMILACGSPELPAVDPDCPPGSIIAFGDSITIGVGLAPDASYPALLSTRLEEPVCNAGVSGDTAAAGLRRLNRDVLQFHPKVVVILFGANDIGLLGKTRETPDHFRSTMSEMVRRIKRTGATPVLCSLPPLNAPLLSKEQLQPGSWPAFDAAVRKVAIKENIALVDLVVAFADDMSLLQDDGLHPNAAGAGTMAAAVAAAIK